ncbi:hypothetical protein NEIRO03_2040 [Nematocida sp. AWRm78]|nr:hypothetical protein NEIRO02_2016 [Nematocida sp. AWRm79]KAI5185452.1 hypothetical protein NEIRO03_2040 [Nematocida sp. AWRm78]
MHFIRYILLVLLYITNIKARMIWKDIEVFKRIVVGSYHDAKMAVSPHESLDPTNLYANSKVGLIYDLCAFDYEVDIKYKMQVAASESGDNNYKCSKTSDKNGTHGLDNGQTSASNLYLKFYRCLNHMFPTVDGRATIYSEEEYSFLAFLNNIPKKKDRLRLLASLFLLSMGVDISLKIEANEAHGDVLVLKTSEDSTENYFSTELKLEKRIYIAKMDENEPCLLGDKYYYTQTKNIVDFYNEIKGATLSSLNYTDVTIDTDKRLIQTYIFEYISNKKDMEEYLVETFNILKEHIEAIEKKDPNDTRNHALSVFNKLFYPVHVWLLDNNPINTDYITEINRCVSEHVFIPFHRELSIPDVLRTCYKNNESSLTGMASSSMNISNPPKHFSPTNLEYLSGLDKFTIGTETSILTLLCCCFYNSIDMEYTLKKIKHSPTELKQFFIKYRDLFNTEDLSVHYNWYNLINTLIIKNPSNSSLKDKYYSGGLLSMLSIILDITNMFEVIKDELNELIKKVREEKNLSSELTANINNLVNKILNFLSYNKKIEVTTESDLRIDTLENHESDIFGKLHLKICNNYNNVVNLTMNFSTTELTAKCDDIYEVMCETGDHSKLTSCFNYLLYIKQRIKESKFLADTRDLMLDYIICKLNRLDNILHGEASSRPVKTQE